MPMQPAAVIVAACACAASAAVHAALVPEHLNESVGLGLAFMLAVLLAALIVSWGVSRSTGIPVLHPHSEAVDLVGAATKLVEALGLACAIWHSQQPGDRRSPSIQEESR